MNVKSSSNGLRLKARMDFRKTLQRTAGITNRDTLSTNCALPNFGQWTFSHRKLILPVWKPFHFAIYNLFSKKCCYLKSEDENNWLKIFSTIKELFFWSFSMKSFLFMMQ